MAFIQNLSLNLNNVSSVGFKHAVRQQSVAPIFESDKYVTNPINRELFNSVDEIYVSAKNNPNIIALLNENNLPLKVNKRAFDELRKGHLQNTRLISARMYSELPPELKSQVNLKELQEAAMYHDYGKVLIPDKILNKEGDLTEKEWKIMKLHSELGYELLKDKGFDDKTLELIKYHHQNPNLTGYPSANKYYEYDISAQILSAADKYTALTENRSYKKSMTNEQALAELSKDVENGNISQEIFDALKRSV